MYYNANCDFDYHEYNSSVCYTFASCLNFWYKFLYFSTSSRALFSLTSVLLCLVANFFCDAFSQSNSCCTYMKIEKVFNFACIILSLLLHPGPSFLLTLDNMSTRIAIIITRHNKGTQVGSKEAFLYPTVDYLTVIESIVYISSLLQ